MLFCTTKVHLENYREEDFQMKKTIREFIIAIKKLKKAVEENLGKDAICGPAVRAFKLVLHHKPWLAWELVVQFHLGKEKYQHAMYELYSVGELGMGAERNETLLKIHHLIVMSHKDKIGYVCAGCYRRIEDDKPEYALHCSIDCLFETEVGAITVPAQLAPPYQFPKPMCIYLMKADELGPY